MLRISAYPAKDGGLLAMTHSQLVPCSAKLKLQQQDTIALTVLENVACTAFTERQCSISLNKCMPGMCGHVMQACMPCLTTQEFMTGRSKECVCHKASSPALNNGAKAVYKDTVHMCRMA